MIPWPHYEVEQVVSCGACLVRTIPIRIVKHAECWVSVILLTWSCVWGIDLVAFMSPMPEHQFQT